MAENTERESIIEELLQVALADGLESMTPAEIIQRALVDSGVLYLEEAESVADGVAIYLERAGKLTIGA